MNESEMLQEICSYYHIESAEAIARAIRHYYHTTFAADRGADEQDAEDAEEDHEAFH